jgi:hypothetical protein
MSQELYFLPATLSLSPIRTLIETSGFALNEIAVFFDFDQTLKQTNVTFLTDKNGNPRISKQSGQPLKESKAAVRGGDVTISFLNYLIDNGVKWYVNTARGAGGVPAVAQSMVNFKIPFSPIMIKPDQQQCLSPTLGFMGESVKYKESEIGICNNVVSAGYDKDVSSEYVMSLLPVKPKLLIFVDDNATNILTLYNYIKYKNPELSYKGVIYEPFLSAEEDHETSMETLRGEGMPPIQDITAEYGASGGRRRNRKSRKNRKNRKQRKSRSQRK